MSFGRRMSPPSRPATVRPVVVAPPTAPYVRSVSAPILRPVLTPARNPRPILTAALSGALFGFGMVTAYAAFALGSPAAFDLVQTWGGETYVIDSGLTADDCRAAIRTGLDGLSCELPR